MEIITADFETYYDKEYSLSKLTTESYIRDPRFETIMLGLRWPDGTKEVITGTDEEIQYRLDAVDWSQYAVLCHNTMFDAAIFTWRYGVRPRLWLDTLSMGRGMFSARNNSLALLAKRFSLDDKGTFVVNMSGRRRADISPGEWKQYSEYCLLDVELCHDLWHLMSEGWYSVGEYDNRGPYPREELRLINQHIRMFTEPVLRLNKDKLETYLVKVLQRKEELLSRTEFDKARLSSNVQFAEVLQEMGVTPPTKISKTTGKPTWAFAKTDPELKALLEHPDPRVQTAVAARLGTKSTLEETRTQTLIEIATRDPHLPVPLKYAYARTKRSSGGDGINLQNLPARGGTDLKACIEAPPGYVMIDCDSSNIEARVLAWLSGQDDLVTDFANSVDVYCKMASRIYNRPITKADKNERFLGKTVVLGCGYQTGAYKLQATLKTAATPMDLDLPECERIIDAYRGMYPQIKRLWYEGEQCIEAMHANKSRWFGREGAALIEGRRGVKLPSGLYVSYPQLHRAVVDNRSKWQYKDDTGVVDIYGGKFTENCIAGGTPVLTDRGWIPIEEVQREDLVHDGVEFVQHGGLVSKSVQACVSIDGVFMTPDHEVLTNDGWMPASQNPRPYRPDLRHVDGVEPRAQRWEEAELALPMPVREAMRQSRSRRDKGDQTRGDAELRLRNSTSNWARQHNARNVKTSGICGVEVNERPMQTANASSMEKLWRQGRHRLRTMAAIFREFLERHGSVVRSWVGLGSYQQRRSLFARELPVDRQAYEHYEQTWQRAECRRTEIERRDRDISKYNLLQTSARMDNRPAQKSSFIHKPVYDILNAGPRHRFVVRGNTSPFIVHNCVQALARIVVMSQLLRIAKKYRVALTVHDSIIALAKEDQLDEARAYVESCMRWVPDWAEGLPINCESKWGYNYGELHDD